MNRFAPSLPPSARGGLPLPPLGLFLVAAVAALWLVALLRAPSDSGSLDARTTAVGATVRCPICPEPIPLNDVQNTQAVHMRQFIRAELQRGVSEDGVRQELAVRYGPSILLAPPQQGFDLLAWIVPLGAVVVCAAVLLRALGRWSSSGGASDAEGNLSDPFVTATGGRADGRAASPDLRRYEEMLNQELERRG